MAEQYGFTYLGGHPMAGTHNSGFKYATATMFHNAPMVLVPANHNDIELLSRVKELLAPAGELRRGVLRPCGGEAPERRGFLSRLPEMARTARQGRCVRALVPWREGEPFPIPELFCFASVGQGRVTYLFDGEGRPIMPK